AKLDAMQKALFEKARAFRDANTFAVASMEEMKARADDGFLLAQWCESNACEARVKEETGGVTSRNRPFDLKAEPGKCVVCANPSPGMMVWSKAY
ncbi:MAG: proline--tRNA ligase, partial [Myxococcaceae bacterium]